eukprot:1343413-Lingulodinium_polyedra.AAC.1
MAQHFWNDLTLGLIRWERGLRGGNQERSMGVPWTRGRDGSARASRRRASYASPGRAPAGTTGGTTVTAPGWSSS